MPRVCVLCTSLGRGESASATRLTAFLGDTRAWLACLYKKHARVFRRLKTRHGDIFAPQCERGKAMACVRSYVRRKVPACAREDVVFNNEPNRQQSILQAERKQDSCLDGVGGISRGGDAVHLSTLLHTYIHTYISMGMHEARNVRLSLAETCLAEAPQHKHSSSFMLGVSWWCNNVTRITLDKYATAHAPPLGLLLAAWPRPAAMLMTTTMSTTMSTPLLLARLPPLVERSSRFARSRSDRQTGFTGVSATNRGRGNGYRINSTPSESGL